MQRDYILELPNDLRKIEGSVEELMEQAQERGGTVANGQGAFLASTAMTVKLLTGSSPPTDELRAALANELGVPEEGLAVVGD